MAPSVILTQPSNARKRRSVSFDYITRYRLDSLLELKRCLPILNVKISGISGQLNEFISFEMYWMGSIAKRR